MQVAMTKAPHRAQPILTRGKATGDEEVVTYRLDKLERLGIITGRWLDCGCNDGSYTVALRDRGANPVVGCDVDPKLIETAQNRWRDIEGVEWVTADAEGLPFPDGAFDGILLNEVLEHIPEQERALAELHRVLRPGGCLCVFSPNRWFPFEGHGVILGARTLGYSIPLLPWLPRRLTVNITRARNYWPSELAGLVRAAGFDIWRVDFAFPLLTKHARFPKTMVHAYRALVPVIERIPFARRFGLSTVVLARKVG